MDEIILHSGSFIGRNDEVIKVTFFKREGERPTPPDPQRIVIEPEYLEVADKSGEYVITITNPGGGEVNISESANWILVDFWKTEDGRDYYRVTVSENTGNEREASITVSAGGESTSMLINQEGTTPTPPTPSGDYEWRIKDWEGLYDDVYGIDIWEADNVYYTNHETMKQLDGNTWVNRTFGPQTLGRNTWYDYEGRAYNSGWYSYGGDSGGNGTHIYKEELGVFSSYVYFGDSPTRGLDVWTDLDGTTYCDAHNEDSGSMHYILKDDRKWYRHSWYGPGGPGGGAEIYIDGRNIWTDHTYIYCSNTPLFGTRVDRIKIGDNFIRSDNGLPLIEDPGTYVWNDTYGNTYFSYADTQLKRVNGQWVDVDWGINIDGRNVWTYQGHTYYSAGPIQLELVRK